MKRTIITLTLATAILLATAAPALATHPTPPPANGMAAPNTEDCRPGGNSHHVGPWTMMTQQEYEVMLLADREAGDPLPDYLIRPGGDDGLIDTWGELVHASATATWEFCDHNDDGLACVMKQTLMGGTFYITLDNHAFPS